MSNAGFAKGYAAILADVQEVTRRFYADIDRMCDANSDALAAGTEMPYPDMPVQTHEYRQAMKELWRSIKF